MPPPEEAGPSMHFLSLRPSEFYVVTNHLKDCLWGALTAEVFVHKSRFDGGPDGPHAQVRLFCGAET